MFAFASRLELLLASGRFARWPSSVFSSLSVHLLQASQINAITSSFCPEPGELRQRTVYTLPLTGEERTEEVDL